MERDHHSRLHFRLSISLLSVQVPPPRRTHVTARRQNGLTKAMLACSVGGTGRLAVERFFWLLRNVRSDRLYSDNRWILHGVKRITPPVGPAASGHSARA